MPQRVTRRILYMCPGPRLHFRTRHSSGSIRHPSGRSGWVTGRSLLRSLGPRATSLFRSICPSFLLLGSRGSFSLAGYGAYAIKVDCRSSPAGVACTVGTGLRTTLLTWVPGYRPLVNWLQRFRPRHAFAAGAMPLPLGLSTGSLLTPAHSLGPPPSHFGRFRHRLY